MKKFLIIASTLVLGTESALAGNIFGDESTENTYVMGSQTAAVTREAPQNVKRVDEGSIENGYYAPRQRHTPVSTFKAFPRRMHHLNCGSPDSQSS